MFVFVQKNPVYRVYYLRCLLYSIEFGSDPTTRQVLKAIVGRDRFFHFRSTSIPRCESFHSFRKISTQATRGTSVVNPMCRCVQCAVRKSEETLKNYGVSKTWYDGVVEGLQSPVAEDWRAHASKPDGRRHRRTTASTAAPRLGWIGEPNVRRLTCWRS